MNNFQYIISSILNQGNFKKIQTIAIINKIIATLPYNLKKSFMHSSIKGKTLLLTFNHPTSVSEFNNYKKNIVLNTIEQLKILKKDSADFEILKDIKDIKAYLPKNILNRFDTLNTDYEALDSSNNYLFEFNTSNIDIEYKTIEYYKERANGDFIIDENSPYAKEFLSIKNAIKKNNESPK